MLALPLGLALFALLPRTPPPQDAPTPDDLAAQLEKIELLQRNRRWSQAEEALLEVLEQHRDERYVLLHWPFIEETFERCAFWADYEAPEPEDVVAGELLSYSERTGKLKIRYRNDAEHRAPWDFEVHEDFWLHPAVFKGPYSLKIQADTDPESVLLACVIDGENHCGAQFDPSRRCVAYRIENGEEVGRDGDFSTDIANLRRGLEVKVSNTKVIYLASGRSVLTGKKPKGLWGRVGFKGFMRIDQVEVSGTVEPSWIQGLADARIQAVRAEFDASYDTAEHAPVWLVRMVHGEGGVEPRTWPAYPGPDHERNAEHMDKAEELLAAEQAAELSSYATNLPAADVTTELRAWLLMLAYMGLERWQPALERCERVCELDPDYLPAEVWRVMLLERTGPRSVALAEARELFGRFPTEPDAAQPLVWLLLLDGRLDEAQEVLVGAFLAGLSPTDLEEPQSLLSRALHGPQWERVHEWRSKHYVVRSDLSEKLCFEAAEVLEESYQKWDLHLRRVPVSAGGARERNPVYLFSGQRGYADYAEDVMGRAPENTAGLYSPALKQLLIWNLPERERMFLTIRHEGFHQYFDLVAPGAPSWLNEGLAEYYETTELERGRWKDGAVQRHHVETLWQRSPNLLPFGELARMTPERFYSDPQLHYAQAWATVHFLLHSEKEQKALFDAYLDAIVAGASPFETFGSVFADVDLERFDAEFRAHVRGL